MVTALVLTAAVHAQSYPVKTVRIIVPVAPGGGTDPQARLLGRKFQESMGQTFVIENRTGAASMIGTEFVVRSPADGYTLLCAASTLAGAYTLRKDLSFDLLKDLAPVGQISSAATFLVVHSSVPVSSITEFIALAKKQAGKLNAGVNDALAQPDVRKRLGDLGMEIVGGSPEDATKYVMRQAERVRGLIKAGVLAPE